MCESYEKAALPLESKLRFAVCALTAGCSVGLLFYDRIAAALLLSVLLIGFFPLYRERERKKRQDALLLQFRDVLYALSSSVSAGRPMTEGRHRGAGRRGGDLRPPPASLHQTAAGGSGIKQ